MRQKTLAALLIAYLFGFNTLFSQGHEINFVVAGLGDTTFLLGNFFGESTYVKDTAKADATGRFVFKGNEKLEPGMYFLVLNKTRLFDFLIGEDQQFSIETRHPEYIPNMVVNGDVDNQLFLQDMLFNAERNKEAQPFVSIIKDSTANETAKSNARKSLDKVSTKVDDHVNEILQKHPNSLLTKIMKANKRLDVPDAPILKNDRPDSTWQFRYIKEHFWDGFDLGDPTLLRLSQPIYRNKLEEYLDKLVVPQADSIISALNKLVGIAKKNSDTYKYLVWSTTLKYQNPEIMGLDRVFVHLYDTYFASGEMDYWANNQLKNNLKERADQLRLSLVGNTAPNLVMQNESLQRRALHEMKNKYTVIYFYDPDCGHCKKETPKLKEFYTNTKYDIGIFTVSADTSMTKMRNYISDMGMQKWTNVNGPRTYTVSYQKQYDALTTPTIYVLNNEKKIIAKKIPAARLEEFLDQYERVEARKTTQNQN